MIYFIRRPSDDCIKIGRTYALRPRLLALTHEYGPGLSVLGIVNESRHSEGAIHRHFAALWVEGEWHRPGPDLLAFIAAHARPWQLADDTIPVRLPAPLVEQARTVAEMEGLPLAHVLTSILAPALAIREQEARERRALAVGLD